MSTKVTTSSNITLRGLAQSVIDDNDCICDEEVQNDAGGILMCPCAGDDCWRCAAAMALANADEVTPAEKP